MSHEDPELPPLLGPRFTPKSHKSQGTSPVSGLDLGTHTGLGSQVGSAWLRSCTRNSTWQEAAGRVWRRKSLFYAFALFSFVFLSSSAGAGKGSPWAEGSVQDTLCQQGATSPERRKPTAHCFGPKSGEKNPNIRETATTIKKKTSLKASVGKSASKDIFCSSPAPEKL